MCSSRLTQVFRMTGPGPCPLPANQAADVGAESSEKNTFFNLGPVPLHRGSPGTRLHGHRSTPLPGHPPGRESGARCLPPRLVPTRALRQEGGFPTRTQRLSPIPHGPAMNPGQREHRRRELLDRRISPPLEESRRWAWWAETPVLVDAKPGGSPYVHCESTGKSGGSLRERRKFAAPPLLPVNPAPVWRPLTGRRIWVRS